MEKKPRLLVGAGLFCAILGFGIGLYKRNGRLASPWGPNKTGSIENAVVMIMEVESGFY